MITTVSKKLKSASVFQQIFRLFGLCGAVLFFSVSAEAQTVELIHNQRFNEDATRAIDHLYNRDVKAAEHEFYLWKRVHPQHPIWELWAGMEIWWDVLSDLYDTSNDQKFINQMRKADYAAANLLKKEPGHADALIIRAVANSYLARLHANREEWVASVQIGRTGYQAYERLIAGIPDLPDHSFAEGIKLYYSAYIPENYPVLRTVSWFLPEGDKAQGLNHLDAATREGVFTRGEANYFLAYIYLNYERQPDKAISYFRQLTENYPRNGVYRRLYVRALYQMNRFGDLLQVFNHSLENREEFLLADDPVTVSELYYWAGRVHFFRGRYERAKEFLETSHTMGSELVKAGERDITIMAAYYAGRVAEQLRDTDQARHYYSIVSGQRTLTSARNNARERLKNL